MFNITLWGTGWVLTNDVYEYLHSDGIHWKTPEVWPTYKDAQAVLDKFQPKHVWKHGDVFEFDAGRDRGTMIYIQLYKGEPKVFYVNLNTCTHNEIDYYLENTTFLFNIKEKL